jgi:hypothetical protein
MPVSLSDFHSSRSGFLSAELRSVSVLHEKPDPLQLEGGSFEDFQPKLLDVVAPCLGLLVAGQTPPPEGNG